MIISEIIFKNDFECPYFAHCLRADILKQKTGKSFGKGKPSSVLILNIKYNLIYIQFSIFILRILQIFPMAMFKEMIIQSGYLIFSK